MSQYKQPLPQRIDELVKASIMFVELSKMWITRKLGFKPKAAGGPKWEQRDEDLKQRAFKGYQPTKHDVFVCTYPKSGTNWMLQIAYQIAHRGRGEYRHIHDVVPWPDPHVPIIVKLSDERTYRNSPTNLRVIKTHLMPQYVPYSPEAKYIVVLRDPKDTFVSSYYFAKAMMDEELPVDQMLKLFLSTSSLYGSWSEHLVSYWSWRDRPNVLVLTFEEMKKDLKGMVRRIAQLMEVDLSDEEFALVVEKSSFQYMKQINHKFVPKLPFPFSRMGNKVMIRKGERGGASELLTPEQQMQIDQQMRADLQRQHCDFPYDEAFTTVADPVFTTP